MNAECFEAQPKRARQLVFCIALIWLVALAGDWALRFRWYHWEQQWMLRPTSHAFGPAAPMMNKELPERRGGDLSNLLGLPAVAARFEEVRPASREVSDEFGFRNEPPTTGVSYRVALTGSSYMNSGVPMTNMLSARLSGLLNEAVYCEAFPGMGPTTGPLRYLADTRFAQRPARVLVWGMVENEIGATPLGGMLAQIQNLGIAEGSTGSKSRISWGSFKPVFLRKSLPNSSALAQFSAKSWRKLRFAIFGELTDDVAISSGDVEGGAILFYTHAAKTLRWAPEQRDINGVARIIKEFSDILERRGTRLVILLIPDKEQVYRELLPNYLASPQNPLPASCLPALAEKLRARGVSTCDLLDAFRARAGAGELLYYRDDTHWNDRGIALAARELAPLLTQTLSASTPTP